MAGIEFDTWDAPLGFEFPGGEIAAEDPPKGTGESLWSRWVQSILQQDKGGPICDSLHQSMKFFHLLPWNFSAIGQSIDVAKVFISKRQAMLFLTNAFVFLKLKKKTSRRQEIRTAKAILRIGDLKGIGIVTFPLLSLFLFLKILQYSWHFVFANFHFSLIFLFAVLSNVVWWPKVLKDQQKPVHQIAWICPHLSYCSFISTVFTLRP